MITHKAKRLIISILPPPIIKWIKSKTKAGRDDYFKTHYASPDFGHEELMKATNPYFAKYGFDFSQYEGKFYSACNGIVSETYIPLCLYAGYLKPYLNCQAFVKAYDDKNNYSKFLDLTKIKDICTCLMPTTLIRNINGLYFDSDYVNITKADAITILMSHNRPFFIKPALETYGGVGVKKIKTLTKENIVDTLDKYSQNYICQEAVTQHPIMGLFNPTSVNTFRVYSYRKPNGEIKILGICVRFGGKGTEVDNACSGGGFCAIGLDGTIDRKSYTYKAITTKQLSDDIPDRLPFVDKLTKLIPALHSQLPYFDYIGWDIAIDINGTPVFIEYNFNASIEIPQTANGPLFSQSDLEELLPLLSNCKVENGKRYWPSKPQHTITI